MWTNSDIIITASNMTRFYSPYKCTLCIKAQENFIYVLVGMGQGKVQKRLMSTFVFMHINEYICIFIFVVLCIIFQYSTVCALFYDNTFYLTAQNFSSLLESALYDTHFLLEESGVHIV